MNIFLQIFMHFAVVSRAACRHCLSLYGLRNANPRHQSSKALSPRLSFNAHAFWQPGEAGKHRGQFAVYCNDELSVYGYSESKYGHHFADFLRVGEHDEYCGFLVTDAASNMDLLEERPGIMRSGCWQHGRDNFKNARISAPPEAEEAIAWIGTFFDVEHDADAAVDTPNRGSLDGCATHCRSWRAFNAG